MENVNRGNGAEPRKTCNPSYINRRRSKKKNRGKTNAGTKYLLFIGEGIWALISVETGVGGKNKCYGDIENSPGAYTTQCCQNSIRANSSTDISLTAQASNTLIAISPIGSLSR